MKRWIKRALTKKLTVKGPRGTRHIEVEPTKNILYLITFSIYALIGLMALQIFHMIWFRSWNSELFSAISGLIGTVTGIFISQKTEGGGGR